MNLFKSQMLHESLAPATAIRAPHFGPRYDRRRPHAPQILHLECPRLLQLGHEQVALRAPANAVVDRAA